MYQEERKRYLLIKLYHQLFSCNQFENDSIKLRRRLLKLHFTLVHT
jgi:hypothetical protein